MKITVCIGEYCHLHGADIVVKAAQSCLEARHAPETLSLKGCFCMRRCHEEGVSVQIDETVHKVKPEDAEKFFTGLFQE